MSKVGIYEALSHIVIMNLLSFSPTRKKFMSVAEWTQAVKFTALL